LRIAQTGYWKAHVNNLETYFYWAGAMMVLTLKVTSAAINYQDGLIKDEDSLRHAQKQYRLKELPSPIAFTGYCLNCGTHLAGPVFEIKDYMEWTEDKGVCPC
jgi:lysophospholipid acyltransferase